MKNDNIKMFVHYHFSKDSRTKSISLLTPALPHRWGIRPPSIRSLFVKDDSEVYINILRTEPFISIYRSCQLQGEEAGTAILVVLITSTDKGIQLELALPGKSYSYRLVKSYHLYVHAYYCMNMYICARP